MQRHRTRKHPLPQRCQTKCRAKQIHTIVTTTPPTDTQVPNVDPHPHRHPLHPTSHPPTPLLTNSQNKPPVNTHTHNNPTRGRSDGRRERTGNGRGAAIFRRRRSSAQKSRGGITAFASRSKIAAPQPSSASASALRFASGSGPHPLPSGDPLRRPRWPRPIRQRTSSHDQP